jgi:hypothetical protein
MDTNRTMINQNGRLDSCKELSLAFIPFWMIIIKKKSLVSESSAAAAADPCLMWWWTRGATVISLPRF